MLVAKLITFVAITMFLLIPTFIVMDIVVCGVAGGIMGAQIAMDNPGLTGEPLQEKIRPEVQASIASHWLEINLASACISLFVDFIIAALFSFTGILPWCRTPVAAPNQFRY